MKIFPVCALNPKVKNINYLFHNSFTPLALGRMQPISRFVNTDLALCVNPHAPEVLARPRPTAYSLWDG